MAKTHRFRVLLVAFFAMLAFVIIEARLYYVQIRQHGYYKRSAKAQHQKTITLNRRRGDILDRKHQVLATSTFYDSIYFNPQMKTRKLPADLPERLGRTLQISEDRIQSILGRDRVTKIKDMVAPEVADAVRLLEEDMRLPDGMIFYVKDSKRLYPKGDLAGPIIGFAGKENDGDNKGLEGLEREFDAILNGEKTQQKVLVNSWQQGLDPMDEEAMAKTFGDTLVLTLDSEIQHFAQKALRKRIGEVQGQSGAAIVMDVKTGGILALATCPDFDPNEFSRATPDQRRNRCLTDPFEIGSVMKILTATILIDNNLLTPDEMVDCEGGFSMRYGRRITDSHKLGVVPFRLAFAESSNIAAAKLGLRLEPNLYYNSLKKFGLGDLTGIELPGENSGLLRPPSRWTSLSRTSLPMGYETSMTAVQVISAVSAIANGGMRMKPRIVERIVEADGTTIEEFPSQEVARVASPETCRTILELMEAVVTEGTGKAAALPGYRIAAKTGTTKKTRGERLYIPSILGILPVENPQIAIYVFVDEPNPKIDFYGGRVAGPVFAEIARESVRILGIPPSDPAAAREARDKAAAKRPEQIASALRENIDGAEALTAKEAALEERELASAWQSIEEFSANPFPVPPSTEFKTGVMPICFGLTMTEVLELAAEAEVPVQLFGTGLAIRQSPAPGIRLGAGETAKIVFAPPSQLVQKQASPAVPAVELPESLEVPAVPETVESIDGAEPAD